MPDATPRFFADPITEQLMESLVALAAEVSVLRDRVARLEAARDGTEPRPPADEAAAFVTSIFGGLTRLPANGKDAA